MECFRKYSLPSRIKDIDRFEETFPAFYRNRDNSTSDTAPNDDVTNTLVSVRRYSWSGCRRGLRLPIAGHIRSNEAHLSRSLPDVIEENWSETEGTAEDISVDHGTEYEDYSRCTSCNNYNQSTSLESVSSCNSSSSSSSSSYCHKCKHTLVVGKLKALDLSQVVGAADRCRWTYSEAAVYSPRTSRKNSSNGVELPVISEPTSTLVDGTMVDDDNNNNNVERIVDEEVEKLIKFKNTKSERLS